MTKLGDIEPQPEIIDTHLHLVFKERLSYPWLKAEPALNRSWLPKEFFATAQPMGVVGAIHMEVDVEDAARLAEAELIASIDNRVIGQVAAVRPEKSEKQFSTDLEKLAAYNHVKGTRRILHLMSDNSWLSHQFAANVRKLADYDFTFDLCVRSDQLHDAATLADFAPKTQFVLDHCGLPSMLGADFGQWASAIQVLASRSNVCAKVSGIVAYGSADWTIQSLRPYVEHVISSFGWQRVVWGSDYPICLRFSGLERWIEATRHIVDGCTLEEKSLLLSKNAIRIYRVQNSAGLGLNLVASSVGDLK